MRKINIESLPKKHQDIIESVEYESDLIGGYIAIVYFKKPIDFAGDPTWSLPVSSTSDLKQLLDGVK